jgi:hypothetical protein
MGKITWEPNNMLVILLTMGLLKVAIIPRALLVLRITTSHRRRLGIPVEKIRAKAYKPNPPIGGFF